MAKVSIREKLSSCLVTARHRSCGKVMFSLVSVHMIRGDPHVSITHDALDLTVHGPQPPPWTSDPTPC